MTMQNTEEIKDRDQPEKVDASGERRREFLKKCGRFAVYAAPAMAIVLAHSRNVSANGGSGV
jgi:hypothetical protein